MMDFRAAVYRYLWKILVVFSQLLNTILGGDPEETLCSRMGRNIKEGRCGLCSIVCFLLGKIDEDHCARSIDTTKGTKP